MPCCHDNHNTVIEFAMQRRAAFSWAGQKAMRSLGSSSLRSRDALHLSSIPWGYIYTVGIYIYRGDIYIPWGYIIYRGDIYIPWGYIYTVGIYIYRGDIYIPWGYNIYRGDIYIPWGYIIYRGDILYTLGIYISPLLTNFNTNGAPYAFARPMLQLASY